MQKKMMSTREHTMMMDAMINYHAKTVEVLSEELAFYGVILSNLIHKTHQERLEISDLAS